LTVPFKFGIIRKLIDITNLTDPVNSLNESINFPVLKSRKVKPGKQSGGRKLSGESISSAILTIASVICAFAFVSAVYPSVISAGDPIMSRTDNMRDQIMTDIEILHETTGAEGAEIHVWVKNVGCRRISSGMIPESDLFFGEEGNFERIPYSEDGNLTPGWSYLIEQNKDGDWDKGETLRIKIKPENSPVSGEKYFIKFSTYNGVSEEAYFTVS